MPFLASKLPPPTHTTVASIRFVMVVSNPQLLQIDQPWNDPTRIGILAVWRVRTGCGTIRAVKPTAERVSFSQQDCRIRWLVYPEPLCSWSLDVSAYRAVSVALTIEAAERQLIFCDTWKVWWTKFTIKKWEVAGGAFDVLILLSRELRAASICSHREIHWAYEALQRCASSIRLSIICTTVKYTERANIMYTFLTRKIYTEYCQPLYSSLKYHSPSRCATTVDRFRYRKRSTGWWYARRVADARYGHGNLHNNALPCIAVGEWW